MSVIERSSNSFVTSTPKPQASDTSSAFLATLRGPHSTHRMMYRLRVSEGRIGKLRVCVLPQSRMKMFEIIVFDIKPLCMHWRADADGEVDDDTSYTGPSGEKKAKSQTRGASEQARADDEEHNLLEDISNPREWKFHSASASENGDRDEHWTRKSCRRVS